uniref:Methyltransferase domain-containing protein n=1 Tax=Laticauda laticaudata TaxID=8630 RepID=A0A8C5SCD0_LATLA
FASPLGRARAPRRQRPASNARYRERGFWDARYEQEGAEPTEWFGGLESFREQLEAELKPGDRILVLGCGNSALSYDLFRLGYTDITNIDYSAVCIASMRDRYAHCSGLHWAVMDARFLTFMDGSFDVVLEKGFLDSIMVEEKDLWNVSQEAKILLDQVLTECGIEVMHSRTPKERKGICQRWSVYRKCKPFHLHILFPCYKLCRRSMLRFLSSLFCFQGHSCTDVSLRGGGIATRCRGYSGPFNRGITDIRNIVARMSPDIYIVHSGSLSIHKVLCSSKLFARMKKITPSMECSTIERINTVCS